MDTSEGGGATGRGTKLEEAERASGQPRRGWKGSNKGSRRPRRSSSGR